METKMTEIAAPGMIFKQIAAVMSEIEAISKNRQNEQQGFKFRGIDDVYNELHPILSKHKIFTVPTVLNRAYKDRITARGGVMNERILTIQYRFYAEDGSYLDCVVDGEAADSGDKATSKAMAIAHKYALLQVFCIPTIDDKDPDQKTPEGYIKEGFAPPQDNRQGNPRQQNQNRGGQQQQGPRPIVAKPQGTPPPQAGGSKVIPIQPPPQGQPPTPQTPPAEQPQGAPAPWIYSKAAEDAIRALLPKAGWNGGHVRDFIAKNFAPKKTADQLDGDEYAKLIHVLETSAMQNVK